MTMDLIGTAASPDADTSTECFHELLVTALPKLRQQAYALTRNRVDADDLVQAAVTNALSAKDSFTPGTNFMAWMSRILRNRFLSDCRRRRETVAVEDAPAGALSRPSSQDDTIALDELAHFLTRLPADHRLALVMVSVQGMSYEDVSAQLGVAVGTLKCRVFRARRQLEAWLLGETAPALEAARKVVAVKNAGPRRPNRGIVQDDRYAMR